MSTLVTWVLPRVIFVVYLAKMIPFWREPTWKRGWVYMYRRHAASWAVVAALQVSLALSQILGMVVNGFSWWSLLLGPTLNAALLWWAIAQRRRCLANARVYEDREVAEAEIPDSPEGLV